MFNQCNINWVNGEAGARAFPLMPGCSAQLMDRDEPIFYIKTVDMSGMPMIRKFSYSEIIPQPASAPSGDFVSRNEFNALMEQLAALNRELGIGAKQEGANNG